MDSAASVSLDSDVVYQDMCLLSVVNFTDDFMDPDGAQIAPGGSVGFSYYVAGPLMTVFIAIGILGNSACVYVFAPFRKKGTGSAIPCIYIYLLALAAWDLLLLASSFLLYNLPELTRGSILTNNEYMTARPYIYCATNSAHTSSNWVVVALGLERFFALCYPFKHRLLDSGRRRAVYVVIGISVAGIFYSLPRLFEVLYEVNLEQPECVQIDDGTYEWVSSPPSSQQSSSSVRRNVVYRTLYKIVGGTVLYSVGPFLCLLIVSIKVSSAIRRQRSFRNSNIQQKRCCQTNRISISHTRNRDHQNNTTTTTNARSDNCSHSINIMLVSVVMKLLFVHALPTGLDVAEMAMGDEQFSNDPIVEYLINFLSLLLAVNSSLNFFIYFVCSKRFRNELRKCCCWFYEETSNHPRHESSTDSTTARSIATWRSRCSCCGRSGDQDIAYHHPTGTGVIILSNEYSGGRVPPVDV